MPSEVKHPLSATPYSVSISSADHVDSLHSLTRTVSATLSLAADIMNFMASNLVRRALSRLLTPALQVVLVTPIGTDNIGG